MFSPTITAFAALSPPWSLQALDNNFSSVSAGLLSANTFSNYIPDTGAVNAYIAVVTLPQTATLSSGLQVQVKITNTNTGASTLNVGATGVKTVLNADGSALTAGQLVAGGVYTFIYDGTNYQLQFGTTFPSTATVQITKLLIGTLASISQADGIAGRFLLRENGSTTHVGIRFLLGDTNTADVEAGLFDAGGSFSTPKTLRLNPNAGQVQTGGSFLANSTVAMPAGGTAGVGIMVSTTANFGIFFGSGAPTLSAGKGSIYLRSDGTTNVTRAYINTDAATTWTAINTVG